MDVVNGKIVPARTERSKSDIWRALQPSGVLVRPEGVGPIASLGMNSGSARWYRRPHDTHSDILGTSLNPLLQFSAGSRSLMDDLDVQEPHRAGWKQSCAEQVDHRQQFVRSSASSRCTDPESSHSTSSTWEKQLHLESGDGPETQRTPGSSEGSDGSGAAVGARERRDEEFSTVDHDGVTWIAPLRSLLRKELTASDVGALGRIVLPKKDAEGQLPLLETNAKYLEMDEYNFSRRWLFQYKCWINNKSRMYVLENTGEFVKYHGLKAHDNFIVYKDNCGNFVVRGKKRGLQS